MKIIALSYWCEQLQDFFEPLCLNMNIADYILISENKISKVIKNKNKAKQILEWGSKNKNQLIETIQKFSPDVIFLWNGDYFAYQDALFECRKLNIPILFWEIAWFPQRSSIQVDPLGVNGSSYLCQIDCKTFIENIKKDFNLLQLKRSTYLKRVNNIEIEKPYTFIPLQVEDDTNILKHSPIKKMTDLVEYVSSKFTHHKIVIKPHPKDKNANRFNFSNDKFIFSAQTNLESLIYHADCVVGINSTSLLESLLLQKPTIALGTSILSNKNVFTNFEKPEICLEHVDEILSRLVTLELDYTKNCSEQLRSHPFVCKYFQ